MSAFFKDMDDDALVAAYWNTRKLTANAANTRSKGLGGLLNDIDIIVAIAHRRGIVLVNNDSRRV
jgi:hypothetical protein